MSLVARLTIARFDPYWKVLPLDLQAVREIAAEYADREPDGSLPLYQPKVFGYFDGEPLSFHRQDQRITHVGWRDTTRLFPCLCRLVRELGCVVYAHRFEGEWTDRVRGRPHPVRNRSTSK